MLRKRDYLVYSARLCAACLALILHHHLFSSNRLLHQWQFILQIEHCSSLHDLNSPSTCASPTENEYPLNIHRYIQALFIVFIIYYTLTLLHFHFHFRREEEKRVYYALSYRKQQKNSINFACIRHLD